MADEELLNGDEEIQDSNPESPAGEETPASGDEAQVSTDTIDPEVESPEGEDSPESLTDSDETADVNPEEGAGKDQVEQEMLEELEKFEGDESQNVSLPDFPELSDSGSKKDGNLELLLDVNLPISIELGRTTMKIKDILSLGPGAVVELKKLAGEPVDLLVNNKVVARGEVVVVDENFGLRITSLLSPEERLRSLNE